MKKTLLSIALFLITISLVGCGGGKSSSSEPDGVNPGIPSIVQLLPVQTIAQTNSFISLKAKVLNGNGNPMENVPVTFTNLSPIGTFVSSGATSAGVTGIADVSRVVMTNSLGIATINLFSTTYGFATVQSEVNTGTGEVRDRSTVYFSPFDLTLPVPPGPPLPTLTLEADGDDDGIFNETGDTTLFEDASDNQVIVRATVTDAGLPAPGVVVTFGADSTEATFPDGDTRTTDSNGQAFTRVKVEPADLRDISTILNITALADNGAFNLLTLFLKPVTVDTVQVSANPKIVDSGGTSKITALVTTTAGTPVPDGTVVNFTFTTNTGGGGIAPFAQTTDGIAEATFTAPTLDAGAVNDIATITASVGGKSGTTTVTVVAPPAEPVTPEQLVIIPSNVSALPGDTISFTITGGTPSYTSTSSDLTVACNDLNSDKICDSSDSGVWTGASITVTIDQNAPEGDVDINVIDSDGSTASAKITVVAIGGLRITPSITSISAATIPTGGKAVLTFNITGGTPTYTTQSSDINKACNDLNSDNDCDTNDSDVWTGTPVSVSIPDEVAAMAPTSVLLNVSDNAAGSASATIFIQP